MEHKKNTKSFASRWGFILASVGSAVGMANVWGFPNKMGSNGGGAFLLIYLLFVFIFSYVGLPAEFAMGRRAATGTLGAYENAWDTRSKSAGKVGGLLGWLPLAGSLCIAIGYAVIVTYVLKALEHSLLGTLLTTDTAAWFGEFSSTPFSVVPYHIIVVEGTQLTLYLGAPSIEKPNKIMMPALFVLFVVLGFIILCTFTQHAITHYAENREAQQLYRESVQIASGYADNYNKYSFSLQDFQKQMQSLGEYLSAQIWIMDNQGNILFDSTDESVGKNAANANYKTLKGFNTSDFGNRYYKTGNFYGSFSEKNLTVFSPITSNYRIHSYVMIHKTVSSITQNANGFMNIVFYTIEFVFLTALFLLLLFAHGFYRPLHRLTIVSESYAKGNFEPRTQIHRNDELGYLANTMDYMANELDTLEEDQRKFISNVSHDFRSPLTSIKGYIEAMLDGTIPPELQNKYLNIILFETERLTKLTQGILDLNRFGQHRGMMLDLTDFDINRMIKTTILTFEGTCSAKGLSFDLVLTGQKLYVHGDMSKIQQVLYNLIDNATKFSHNDASIKIETSIKNEKVLISVKDSGIGIPAESIKKIWDRFYKTDLSRGKDKRGTGLGLAIVKEIIQAHNEHINVISTEGVGTEFIFTLPLAKKEVQS